MRLNGFRKTLYLLTGSNPELNRRLLQLGRSTRDVAQQLENRQKAGNRSGKKEKNFLKNF